MPLKYRMQTACNHFALLLLVASTNNFATIIILVKCLNAGHHISAGSGWRDKEEELYDLLHAKHYTRLLGL